MQNNEKKAPRIAVPGWMKEETPLTAQFCELVNFALEGDPDMSLAAFAEILHTENVRASVERLEAIEAKQFGTNEGVKR
jgi:hypothetical protein